MRVETSSPVKSNNQELGIKFFYLDSRLCCYHNMDTPCHLSFLNSWKLHRQRPVWAVPQCSSFNCGHHAHLGMSLLCFKGFTVLKIDYLESGSSHCLKLVLAFAWRASEKLQKTFQDSQGPN